MDPDSTITLAKDLDPKRRPILDIESDVGVCNLCVRPIEAMEARAKWSCAATVRWSVSGKIPAIPERPFVKDQAIIPSNIFFKEEKRTRASCDSNPTISRPRSALTAAISAVVYEKPPAMIYGF